MFETTRFGNAFVVWVAMLVEGQKGTPKPKNRMNSTPKNFEQFEFTTQ